MLFEYRIDAIEKLKKARKQERARWLAAQALGWPQALRAARLVPYEEEPAPVRGACAMAEGLRSSSRKGAAVGCPHQSAGTLENTGSPSAPADQTLGEAVCKGLQDVPHGGRGSA